MNYEFFKLEIQKNIAHLSFNRPEKANALHAKAWEEMEQIFAQLDQEQEVRVIILSGEGKHFCAGIDLELLMSLQSYNQIKGEGRKREALRGFIKKLQAPINAIENCRKPVIAAIHNGCIGGGVDISVACDMRFCTKDAYFTIKEIDMGMVADLGTLQRLPKIIAPGMVAEMAYTGRKVYGAEAVQIGLVNKTYENKEALMAGVLELATTIAEKSPLSIRGTKEILLHARDHSVADGLEYMATWNAATILSDDLLEAFQAKMEGRKAEFKN